MSKWTKFFQRFSLEQKMVTGFGLALATLMAVGAVQYRDTQALIETDRWVAHTNAVRTELEEVYSAIQQAEAGTRGFVATGNEGFLQQYQMGVSRTGEYLRALPGLIADDPYQRHSVDKLLSLTDRKIAVMQGLVSLRRDRGFVAASQELNKGVGLRVMNETRKLVDSMQLHEMNLLQVREAASRARARIADAALILGVLLALILGIVAGLLLHRGNLTRQQAEQELRRVDRALRTISGCNQILVRVAEESQLLKDICEILVSAGGYRMAWVGFAENDEGRSVHPVAHAGFEEGYLQGAGITWADTEPGRGPTGTAIRTGKHVVARDFRVDSSVAPWREKALKRSYASSIALPILLDNHVLGALTIYAEEPDAFDSVEMQLLTELSNDLAYGIQAVRTRTERQRAEEALRKANAYNRGLLEASLDPLVTISVEGKITDVNEATVKVTGVRREELIGTDFSNYFTGPEQARAGYREVFERGSVTDYPLTIRHESGKLTDVLYNASVYRGSDGNVLGVFAAARDITDRKRAEEALRRANAYNRSLIEASLDPLLTIAPDGKITDVNTATEKATGRSRQELIGTDFSDYFTNSEKARAGYQQVFREGWVQDYALDIRHRDGHITPVLYNASVYRDDAGQVIGVFAAARDITERKLAEEELRKLNEELDVRVRGRTVELEAANKELEAFTYSVSHDLRAPLRHVDGFSKLLQEEHGKELSADAQDYVSTIRESVLQMGVLIDDLLNLARIGRKELNVQVAGLNSLVEEVVGDLQQANPHRQLDWRIQTLPFVECDPALLKQVFVNLLSNAVKFTRPRNPAVIEVGTCRQDDHTAIYVRDNGVGFSMKYVDKLFGVFQRLHRSEDFEGTGVGLATVQRIIRKHGGRVWAEGKLDQGATFHFTLGSLDERPDGPFPSGGNI